MKINSIQPNQLSKANSQSFTSLAIAKDVYPTSRVLVALRNDSNNGLIYFADPNKYVDFAIDISKKVEEAEIILKDNGPNIQKDAGLLAKVNEILKDELKKIFPKLQETQDLSILGISTKEGTYKVEPQVLAKLEKTLDAKPEYYPNENHYQPECLIYRFDA